MVLAAGSTGVTLAQSLGIVGTSLDTAGYSAARAVLVTSRGHLLLHPLSVLYKYYVILITGVKGFIKWIMSLIIITVPND